MAAVTPGSPQFVQDLTPPVAANADGASPPFTPPMDDAGRLAVSLPCMACGYDLRTMRSVDRCPECGCAVSHSARGDLFQFAPHAHLRMIVRSLRLLLIVHIMPVLLGITLVLTDMFMPSVLAHGPVMVSCVILIGAMYSISLWRLGGADVDQLHTSGEDVLALVLRCTLVGQMVAMLCMVSFAWQDEMRAQAMALLVGHLSGSAVMAMLYLRLSRAAWRIPSLRMHRHSRRLVWGFVAMGLLGVPEGLQAIRLAGIIEAQSPAYPASWSAGFIYAGLHVTIPEDIFLTNESHSSRSDGTQVIEQTYSDGMKVFHMHAPDGAETLAVREANGWFSDGHRQSDGTMHFRMGVNGKILYEGVTLASGHPVIANLPPFPGAATLPPHLPPSLIADSWRQVLAMAANTSKGLIWLWSVILVIAWWRVMRRIHVHSIATSAVTGA